MKGLDRVKANITQRLAEIAPSLKATRAEKIQEFRHSFAMVRGKGLADGLQAALQQYRYDESKFGIVNRPLSNNEATIAKATNAFNALKAKLSKFEETRRYYGEESLTIKGTDLLPITTDQFIDQLRKNQNIISLHCNVDRLVADIIIQIWCEKCKTEGLSPEHDINLRYLLLETNLIPTGKLQMAIVQNMRLVSQTESIHWWDLARQHYIMWDDQWVISEMANHGQNYANYWRKPSYLEAILDNAFLMAVKSYFDRPDFQTRTKAYRDALQSLNTAKAELAKHVAAIAKTTQDLYGARNAMKEVTHRGKVTAVDIARAREDVSDQGSKKERDIDREAELIAYNRACYTRMEPDLERQSRAHGYEETLNSLIQARAGLEEAVRAAETVVEKEFEPLLPDDRKLLRMYSPENLHSVVKAREIYSNLSPEEMAYIEAETQRHAIELIEQRAADYMGKSYTPNAAVLELKEVQKDLAEVSASQAVMARAGARAEPTAPLAEVGTRAAPTAPPVAMCGAGDRIPSPEPVDENPVETAASSIAAQPPRIVGNASHVFDRPQSVTASVFVQAHNSTAGQAIPIIPTAPPAEGLNAAEDEAGDPLPIPDFPAVPTEDPIANMRAVTTLHNTRDVHGADPQQHNGPVAS